MRSRIIGPWYDLPLCNPLVLKKVIDYPETSDNKSHSILADIGQTLSKIPLCEELYSQDESSEVKSYFSNIGLGWKWQTKFNGRTRQPHSLMKSILAQDRNVELSDLAFNVN